MSKNITERMFRFCGNIEWFIGKSPSEKGSDIARSINRAGKFYVRIPQSEFTLFLTTEPRRLRDAEPLDMDRVAIKRLIDDSLSAMPDNSRSTTNIPELPKDDGETLAYYLPEMSPSQVDSIILESGNTVKNITTRYSSFHGNGSSIQNALVAMGVEVPEYPEDDPYSSRP